MDRAYGKRAAAAEHQKFRDAIGQAWSDVWMFDKSLRDRTGK